MPSNAVQSLWRYPVKSMLGETLAEATVTARGLSGDRAYAVLDQTTGKIASAKLPRKWHSLLACRAACLASEVQLTLPDGTVISSAQSDCDQQLTALCQRAVALTNVRPAQPAVENLDPFAETISDSGAFMWRDGFADYAPVHLLTTATLAHLQALYPQSDFDPRRFRPNILVQTDAAGFCENDWVGRTVAIGAEVRLRIADPAPRCVMITLAQGDLPNDLEVLRAVQQNHRVPVPTLGGKAFGCVGMYGFVLQGGLLRCGDTVRVE